MMMQRFTLRATPASTPCAFRGVTVSFGAVVGLAG